MTECEQVISHLKIIRVWHECHIKFNDPINNKASEKTVQWIDDTLKLLEEQQKDGETSTQRDIRLMLRDHIIGFCPECKEICIKAVNKNFCGSCGQGVKWDD